MYICNDLTNTKFVVLTHSVQIALTEEKKNFSDYKAKYKMFGSFSSMNEHFTILTAPHLCLTDVCTNMYIKEIRNFGTKSVVAYVSKSARIPLTIIY